jgi:hypothetical protein
LIFEKQLAPLEAFHLQLIHFEIHAEARNHVVKIAMLDPQLTQALDVLEQIGIDVALFVTHGGCLYVVLKTEVAPHRGDAIR